MSCKGITFKLKIYGGSKRMSVELKKHNEKTKISLEEKIQMLIEWMSKYPQAENIHQLLHNIKICKNIMSI